ncbi:MAG: discoidin domain-containing protein [Planctomycetes bacterium]|nr:discoidin domain-containing protein [Planctomycetota bacterium]
MCGKKAFLAAIALSMVAGLCWGQSVKINFQQATSITPDGYLPDSGQVFGDRGNGFSYGWEVAVNETRDRGRDDIAPDQRYDTLNHLQKGGRFEVWEIELENAEYGIFLVGGDSNHTDQVNHFDVEGVIVLDPDGQDNFDEWEFVVTIADGRLTITPTPEAQNSKLMFIDITLLTPPELATRPGPAKDANDVSRDIVLSWQSGIHAQSHNVFLGTGFDDVNNATVGVGQGLADMTFDPGRLEFGQTYYWRVDEVNSAPDSTVFKGETWSFTTEPFSIPIMGITATASSSFGDSGPERTIDGSGMSDDLHGTDAGDMWISGGVPATLEYAFDRAYKLHELWIWNSNQLIEAFVGFGGKDVVIEHSLDGANWTVLDGVGPLAQAPGSEGYAHNNTIDFGGATAQHVRVTINSVQGIAPQASLSEVRFYYIPTFATRPNPASGATDVAPDVSLSWGRNGREADRHEVLIGSDPENLSSAATVNESSFDTLALDLQLGETYSWRVDEINDVMDPSTWMGDVWSFTTADAILIDDMESYKDAEFLEIWATWVDGFDDPANGSLVGGTAGIPETGIVNGGSQSLPLDFDNSAAAVSEATRTFDAPMDWSRSGVKTLVLSFSRGAENTGNGRVYVKVNDTKVVHPEDPAALPPGWDQWTQWNIDLTHLGVDLTRVRSLTIGIEGAGAKGVLYVDDIQLEGVASESGSLTWFEAEAADILGASWRVVNDPTASGGIRIGSENDDGNDNNTAPGAEWVAAYTFTVPADGVYGLALRAQEAGSDSFWVRIVGAISQSHEHPGQAGTGWVRFNGIDAPDGWAWDLVHSNDHGNAVVSWTLPAGPLTLEIAKREDGVYLDAIAVTQ